MQTCSILAYTAENTTAHSEDVLPRRIGASASICELHEHSIGADLSTISDETPPTFPRDRLKRRIFSERYRIVDVFTADVAIKDVICSAKLVAAMMTTLLSITNEIDPFPNSQSTRCSNGVLSVCILPRSYIYHTAPNWLACRLGELHDLARDFS